MNERNERKKQFINWLVRNYQHVNPSVDFLLKYIASNPDLIQQIEFSEASKYAPRGLYISYLNNSSVPFIYYKDQLSFTMSDQAFHDIRLNNRYNKGTFYIELNLKDAYKQLYRYDIFVENPFLPADQTAEQDLDTYLYQISQQAQIKQLQKQIDKALDAQDFSEVNYYLDIIEKLKGE